MPDPSTELCDVLDCRQPAAGSYLHAADARSVQFAICPAHLSELRAGARPSVAAEQVDPAAPDARPALLLESAWTVG
jgi:hypothetical protein